MVREMPHGEMVEDHVLLRQAQRGRRVELLIAQHVLCQPLAQGLLAQGKDRVVDRGPLLEKAGDRAAGPDLAVVGVRREHQHRSDCLRKVHIAPSSDAKAKPSLFYLFRPRFQEMNIASPNEKKR